MADVIDDVLAELRAEFPEVRGDKLREVEFRIRDRWGGERSYVARAPGKKKAFSIGTALSIGMTLDEAFSAVGVSQRWGYRLLTRRW